MKRFIVRVGLFFLLLFCIDQMLGYVFSYMANHNNKGGMTHRNYIVDGTNEDILIFGSSRAEHHYNPQIIQDSLGLSCYNCGQDGYGIIQYYGWWKIIRQHYKPKIIIYDVFMKFDLLAVEDNRKYLGGLKNLYSRDHIKDIFIDVDNSEQYKMLSMLYRYNSSFHKDVSSFFFPKSLKNKGFKSIQNQMDVKRMKKDGKSIKGDFSIDSLKLAYLNKFIEEKEGVKVFFVISPTLYGIDLKDIEPVRNLCQKKEIPLLDFSNDSKYVRKVEFFSDYLHLNAKGADEFTRDFIEKLRDY